MTNKQFVLLFVFFVTAYFSTVILIQTEMNEKYNKLAESCVVIK